MDVQLSLNAPLFLQTADVIEADPEAYNQYEYGVYGDRDVEGDYALAPSCGSPCCVAGWFTWLTHMNNVGDDIVPIVFHDESDGEQEIDRIGQMEGGLTDLEASCLFNANWPDHWFSTVEENSGQPLVLENTYSFRSTTSRPTPEQAVKVLRYAAKYGFSL